MLISMSQAFERTCECTKNLRCMASVTYDCRAYSKPLATTKLYCLLWKHIWVSGVVEGRSRHCSGWQQKLGPIGRYIWKISPDYKTQTTSEAYAESVTGVEQYCISFVRLYECTKYHLMSLKFLHAETFDSIHVTLKISMHVFPQNPKFSPLTLWNAGHTCASGATSTHVWLHAGVHRFREKPGQPRQTRQVRSAKGVHGNQRN